MLTMKPEEALPFPLTENHQLQSFFVPMLKNFSTTLMGGVLYYYIFQHLSQFTYHTIVMTIHG